jgi:hypothetical protein
MEEGLMIVECTHCRAFVDAKEHGSFGYYVPSAGSGRYALLACSKCEAPMVVRQVNVGNLADGDIWDTPERIFPSSEQRANPKAPADIRIAFEEACSCHRARAYTAAAIMCRKTLEGVCEAHGVKERTLAASLKKMKDTSLIDDRLFEWSDALRLLGNEAAHGVGKTISETDASDILEFSNAILDYLFSYRDRFEAFKKRRSPQAPIAAPKPPTPGTSA